MDGDGVEDFEDDLLSQKRSAPPTSDEDDIVEDLMGDEHEEHLEDSVESQGSSSQRCFVSLFDKRRSRRSLKSPLSPLPATTESSQAVDPRRKASWRNRILTTPKPATKETPQPRNRGIKARDIVPSTPQALRHIARLPSLPNSPFTPLRAASTQSRVFAIATNESGQMHLRSPKMEMEEIDNEGQDNDGFASHLSCLPSGEELDDFSGPEEEPLMDCDEEDIQDSPPRGALSDKEPAVKPEVNRKPWGKRLVASQNSQRIDENSLPVKRRRNAHPDHLRNRLQQARTLMMSDEAAARHFAETSGDDSNRRRFLVLVDLTADEKKRSSVFDQKSDRRVNRLFHSVLLCHDLTCLDEKPRFACLVVRNFDSRGSKPEPFDDKISHAAEISAVQCSLRRFHNSDSYRMGDDERFEILARFPLYFCFSYQFLTSWEGSRWMASLNSFCSIYSSLRLSQRLLSSPASINPYAKQIHFERKSSLDIKSMMWEDLGDPTRAPLHSQADSSLTVTAATQDVGTGNYTSGRYTNFCGRLQRMYHHGFDTGVRSISSGHVGIFMDAAESLALMCVADSKIAQNLAETEGSCSVLTHVYVVGRTMIKRGMHNFSVLRRLMRHRQPMFSPDWTDDPESHSRNSPDDFIFKPYIMIFDATSSSISVGFNSSAIPLPLSESPVCGWKDIIHFDENTNSAKLRSSNIFAFNGQRFSATGSVLLVRAIRRKGMNISHIFVRDRASPQPQTGHCNVLCIVVTGKKAIDAVCNLRPGAEISGRDLVFAARQDSHDVALYRVVDYFRTLYGSVLAACDDSAYSRAVSEYCAYTKQTVSDLKQPFPVLLGDKYSQIIPLDSNPSLRHWVMREKLVQGFSPEVVACFPSTTLFATLPSFYPVTLCGVVLKCVKQVRPCIELRCNCSDTSNLSSFCPFCCTPLPNDEEVRDAWWITVVEQSAVNHVSPQAGGHREEGASGERIFHVLLNPNDSKSLDADVLQRSSTKSITINCIVGTQGCSSSPTPFLFSLG